MAWRQGRPAAHRRGITKPSPLPEQARIPRNGPQKGCKVAEDLTMLKIRLKNYFIGFNWLWKTGVFFNIFVAKFSLFL